MKVSRTEDRDEGTGQGTGQVENIINNNNFGKEIIIMRRMKVRTGRTGMGRSGTET